MIEVTVALTSDEVEYLQAREVFGAARVDTILYGLKSALPERAPKVTAGQVIQHSRPPTPLAKWSIGVLAVSEDGEYVSTRSVALGAENFYEVWPTKDLQDRLDRGVWKVVDNA